MINICPHCGSYRADKTIDPSGPYAVCPECGHKQPFLYLPLLVIGGASGAGKSSVCNFLLGKFQDAILLDSDILWRPEFNTPEDHYHAFFDLWLRMCKNIAQSGRPVALFGAGMGVPANLEGLVERRYFSAIHYLALVCDDEELARRLRARSAWRNSGGESWVESQIAFNRWFKEVGVRPAGQPPVELLDTTCVPLEKTAAQVAAWIKGKPTAPG
jgi:hypothetical protein